MATEFSVVIATRNRRALLGRAIRSALAQDAEIIVVDDGSTDGTAEYVRETFPTVRLFQVAHGGPGPARNAGLAQAEGRWAIVLDDDDELRPDALRTIAGRLAELDRRDHFPAFLFRHGNGRMPTAFQILGPEQLSNGGLGGDFLPVWNREVARAAACRYPEVRIGAEGLMWLEIADRFGVPTWADCVGIVHDDAGDRLTGTRAQLRNAAEHARVQDRYVEFLRARAPTPSVQRLTARRLLAAGFYYLLAGERRTALARARTLLKHDAIRGAALLLACGVPRRLLAGMLRMYRA
ncbi:MAG TPA: glycosyltransferase family 2 protein [Gemmatimonadales bacterium]|nr:glycosyltransferase family 2 protein [Gemmatimonadales bacterium]